MLVSTLVAFAGIGVATYFFRSKPQAADAMAARFGGVHRLLLGKYYVDELYDATIVQPIKRMSTMALWRGVDAGVIDGTVNAVGLVVARLERGAAPAADRIDSRLRDVVLRRRRVHRRLLPVEMMFPLLSSLVVLPVVGALLLFVAGKGQDKLVRYLALGVSLATFVVSLVLWYQFDPASADYQFVERHAWLPDFGISYHVGVDGISLLLVVLTTFLTPIALLCSWDSIEDRVREFSFFMLVLEAAMIGVFISLDLFLFYVFWDAMLDPDVLPHRDLGLRPAHLRGRQVHPVHDGGQRPDAHRHHLDRLLPPGGRWACRASTWPTSPRSTFRTALQTWLFLAFAVAFAIKVPLFPFHTWLPDAHVEAPTAGSVILAGVLLKMGTYGLLRFAFPLFPHAAQFFAPYLAMLAVIGIVYGALVAMVQPDMKKLVAYSSVSHLGFVVLGICALNVNGAQGAVYQMLAHGVSTGGLFLIVGMLSDRRHTRAIAEYGGLKAVTPQAGRRVPAHHARVGRAAGHERVRRRVPDPARHRSPAFFEHASVYTAVAATGVILSAVYMLWMFQRVNYGPVTNAKNRGLRDLSVREWFVIAPVCAMCIVMGVVPGDLPQADGARRAQDDRAHPAGVLDAAEHGTARAVRRPRQGCARVCLLSAAV